MLEIERWMAFLKASHSGYVRSMHERATSSKRPDTSNGNAQPLHHEAMYHARCFDKNAHLLTCMHLLLLRLRILVAHDGLLLRLLALHSPLACRLVLRALGVELGLDALLTGLLGLRGVNL